MKLELDSDIEWETTSFTSEEEQVSDNNERQLLPHEDNDDVLFESQGRDRHTWRVRRVREQHEMSIKREKKQQKHGDLVEIPITEIDQYFDSGFIHQDQCYANFQGTRLLNQRDQWECVERLLHELAIHKVQYFNKNAHTMVTEFRIPIIGHILYNAAITDREAEKQSYGRKGSANIKSRANKQRGWLQWNGKLHDPSFVYEFIPGLYPAANGSLRALCPLIGTMRNHMNNYISNNTDSIAADEDRKAQYGEVLAQGTLIDPAAANGYFRFRNTKNTEKRKSTLELDLKTVSDITSIVVMGGFPRDLELFPTSKRIYEQQPTKNRYKRKRRRRKRSPTVYIVKNRESLAWVEWVGIQYRDVTSGKWQSYGDRFKANCDVGTEVTIDVSIRARYIRIVPIEYHHFKELRASVFGHATSTDDQGRVVAIDDAQAVKSVDTILYTLYPAEHCELRMDGYTDAYRRDYYGFETKHSKRTNRAREVQQQLACMN
jgi:hypothetical protein